MIENWQHRGRACGRVAALVWLAVAPGCGRHREDAPAAAPASAPPAAAAPAASASVAPAASSPSGPFTPEKVDLVEPAMGTEVHFVAYTTPELDRATIEAAMHRAHAEIVRVEGVMTSWRDSSEIGQINAHAGSPVTVSDETVSVLEKSLWASELSGGAF